MSNINTNQTNVNQQAVLRDTPSGIPVKTRIKAGKKIAQAKF